MTLRATEVFTPGSFPERTYVERTGSGLEQSLRDALETNGQIVSLVGPSKSGKTVLVEKVVGRDDLITVTGGGIRAPEDIWVRVLDWMGTPAATTETQTISGTLGGEVSAGGGAGILGIAKVTGEVKGTAQLGLQRETSASSERRGLPQVVKEIANSGFVVLLDDFHYMHRDVQVEAAKTLKEAK